MFWKKLFKRKVTANAMLEYLVVLAITLFICVKIGPKIISNLGGLETKMFEMMDHNMSSFTQNFANITST